MNSHDNVAVAVLLLLLLLLLMILFTVLYFSNAIYISMYCMFIVVYEREQLDGELSVRMRKPPLSASPRLTVSLARQPMCASMNACMLYNNTDLATDVVDNNGNILNRRRVLALVE